MTVSKLSEIHIYPIKSTSGIQLSSSWVDDIGLPFDRRFVLTDLSGQFITARTHPRLCLIQANLTATGFILTAPDMPVLHLNYDTCLGKYSPMNIWKDQLQGERCSEATNQWFSQYLSKECQLLHFGQQSHRQVSKTNHPVAFADGYPLLLISQASLSELNSRLNQPVSMANFRPNIVVQGCAPFEEDTWRHIRIGEVEFEVTKPCSRCIFTTVNPETGDKHMQQEPLTTLKTYRQVASGDVMFGQNMIPLNTGQIKLNDPLSILATGKSPDFVGIKSTAKQPRIQSPITHETLRRIDLVCKKIIDETHDVKTFILQGTKNETFNYIAGQHLPLSLLLNGKETRGIYTLSSSPSRPHHLSITVKRVKGGKLSNYLHDHFNVGDKLQGFQPKGDFHLQSVSNSKMLLLSAGSGITPMLSMLRAMTDSVMNNDIIFFHSAKSEQDLIAKEEISSLAKQHGSCQVIYTLTRNAKPDWQEHQGHIDERMLAGLPGLTEREVMVCGPESFRESAKNILMKLGLPESQFHYESFGTRHLPTQEENTTKQKIKILFDSWDRFVEGNNQETLLDQGEAAGLILPYSCRGGMCGSCKVKLEDGTVRVLADDGLMAQEKDDGYVLACSCIPTSDVVIGKG